MKNFTKLTLALGLTLCLTIIASAATPLGGLAVAVSPDGKRVITAGDSRTLYIIDSATMEITTRYWLGTPILALRFNKTGDRIVAESSDEALLLIDAATGKVIKQEEKAGKISSALSADLAAALNANYSGNIIRFFSLSDLTVKGSINLAKGEKVAALALAPDAQKAVVWLEAENDDSEPKNSKVPDGIKGLEAEEFRLRNDGKTSRLLIFNVADGSKLSEHKIYFSPSTSGATIALQGDNIFLITYSNTNAKIDAKGEVTLFKLKSGFNYGTGVSADHQTVLGGGLAAGDQLKTADMSQKEFKVDRLPGWPEYFKDFAIANDGTGYGSTSAYRIIKINADGSFDKSYPVF